MKKQFTLLSLLPVIVIMLNSCKDDVITPESLGWKLAYQSFTFRSFTFEEGLQKGDSLGLRYVEPYPGQTISTSNQNTTLFKADANTRAEMKRLLDQYQIKMITYGVVLPRNEEEWKQVFEFAKEMGVQTLTVMPRPQDLDYIERMCGEYDINIAIHNKPAPSQWSSPDSVLKYISGRSERVGACGDIGHWVRSGLDPLECLRILKGRMISLHFKDVNEKDRHAHDVIWGTGICDVPALLQELKDQGFSGVFSIEHEHNWDNNVPEIARSIENFREITAELR
jgi:sugar phosphate isomerase/epimerase